MKEPLRGIRFRTVPEILQAVVPTLVYGGLLAGCFVNLNTFLSLSLSLFVENTRVLSHQACTFWPTDCQ